MTFEQAIQNNKAFADEWQAELSPLIIEMGTTGVTMMKNRILQRGMNADNQKYDPYSTAPMLTNCSAMTDAACAKTKTKDKKWVTLKRGGRNIRLFELAGGYKEFRELHGRQTGFVDFAFSGRMWADVQIVDTKFGKNTATATIGTLTDEQNKKLAGNTARRGDILELSDEEIAKLGEIVTKRIDNLLAKHDLL
jgi:Tfp pilus assembly protein PilV